MSRLVDKDDAVATRTLKVCCIGLPKTGTPTLHTALSNLGYRVYHFSALAQNGRRDMDLLHEALLLKQNPDDENPPYGPQDFDKVWGKYDAVGDLPGFAFVDELVAYYPQAQFILTDRNVDAWARAMRASWFVEFGSWGRWFRAWGDGEYVRPLRRLLLCWLQKFCRSEFGDGLREAYIDHVQHCLKVVPKEKLLILRFGEQNDWHDLCEFLGKDVPDTAYPAVDDELVLFDQRQHCNPHWRMALGKLCAFALGAALTASLCWCIID